MKTLFILLFLTISIPCINSNDNWNRKKEIQKAIIWDIKQKYPPNDLNWMYQISKSEIYKNVKL